MTPHKSVKRGPADFDESSDTYDSIDWLLKNIKGNNGKAGIIGISYPALKTASPHAPVIDLFLGGDAYHNGAFVLAANFGFCTCFGKKKTELELPDANARHFAFASRDGYDFYKRFGPLAYADEKYFKRESAYWTDLLAHTAYDDFWKSRNLTQHVKNISPAVLTVGGWFDAEDLQGPLRLDAALEKQSPATRHTSLWASGCMMAECGVMETSLAASLSISRPFRAFTKKVEFPCFEFHLNGKPDPKLSRAIIFETGSNRCGNFDAWPPRARRKISISTPTANSALRLPRKPKVPLNS